MEHLTAEELWEFLFHRDHKDDGLLQRFVPPRDGLNHVFRVVWSPDIVMMERRQNSTSMHDRSAKTTPHHRALTVEDEAGASRSRPVKCPLLGRRLRQACERIVQHAATVSLWRMRLTRLVLHFKLDAADRLCFLWCSSLRTSPGVEPALEGWLLGAKGAAASRLPPPTSRLPASPHPRYPPRFPPSAFCPLPYHARTPPSTRPSSVAAPRLPHASFTAELPPAELQHAGLGCRGFMRLTHRRPQQK